MPTALSVIATNYCASAGKARKPTGRASSRIQGEKPEQLHGKINHVCIAFHRGQVDTSQALLIPRYKHEPQKQLFLFNKIIQDLAKGLCWTGDWLVQLLELGVPSCLVWSWLVKKINPYPPPETFLKAICSPHAPMHTPNSSTDAEKGELW